MKQPTIAERPVDPLTTPSVDGEVPIIRWTNRRKMAWRAFTCLVVFTAVYWFLLPLWFQWWLLPTTWLTIIGDSYFWFATTMAAIIIGYMGFTSLPFWGGGATMRPSSGPSTNNQISVAQDDF